MILKELLETLPDDKNICLGAQTSFLYIAPKQELMEYLKENIKAVDCWNDDLKADQAKGERIEEEPKIYYLDREVIRCEWNDRPHHGYIVIIKGTESGRYSLRCEITGEPMPPLESVDEEAARDLIAAVLAESADDIAQEKFFRMYYGESGLSLAGKRILEARARAANKARKYLADKENLAYWTSSDGGWITKMAEKKAEVMVHKKDQKLTRNSMTKKFKDLYDNDGMKHKIEDMIIEGASAAEILEKVGRGTNGQATEEDIEDLAKRFENARELERRRFLLENFKDSRNPIKDQMTMNERIGEEYMRIYCKKRKEEINDGGTVRTDE